MITCSNSQPANLLFNIQAFEFSSRQSIFVQIHNLQYYVESSLVKWPDPAGFSKLLQCLIKKNALTHQ